MNVKKQMIAFGLVLVFIFNVGFDAKLQMLKFNEDGSGSITLLSGIQINYQPELSKKNASKDNNTLNLWDKLIQNNIDDEVSTRSRGFLTQRQESKEINGFTAIKQFKNFQELQSFSSQFPDNVQDLSFVKKLLAGLTQSPEGALTLNADLSNDVSLFRKSREVQVESIAPQSSYQHLVRIELFRKPKETNASLVLDDGRTMVWDMAKSAQIKFVLVGSATPNALQAGQGTTSGSASKQGEKTKNGEEVAPPEDEPAKASPNSQQEPPLFIIAILILVGGAMGSVVYLKKKKEKGTLTGRKDSSGDKWQL